MKTLIKFILRQLPTLLIAGIIGGISLSMSVGLLAASSWLISMASTRPPILVLEVAIVSVRFFGLARGVVRYFGRLQEHEAALSIQSHLRESIYSTIEGQSPLLLMGRRRGQLIQQIGANSELVQDLWLRLFLPWISALIAGVSGVGIISWLHPNYAGVLAIIFLITMAFIPFVAILTGTGVAQGSEEEMNDEFMQSCDALAESLVFGEGEKIESRLNRIQQQVARAEIRNSITTGMAEFLHFLILGITIFIGLNYASSAVQDGSLTGVNIAVLALVPLAMFDSLPSVYAAFSNYKLIYSRVQALKPYLVKTAQLEDQEDLLAEHSQITIKNLVPSTVIDRVEPLSFELDRGRPTILSGRSGSGKSSVIYSILKFIPFLGEIEITGKVVALLQTDHLFMTSIRENIKIANPEVEDQEIWQMLEVMELAELIHSLPQGLDTHIGEYGYNFSGGERQRLKLARVLICNSDIYLLDEPFEYLDEEMANRLATRVASILANKRVLIVSHLPLKIEGNELTLRVTA